jgi:hypothetical protein
VQHRLFCEFKPDEIFGTPVMLVGLDAPEEANALSHVHQGVAVGEFAEIERPADGGADGRAPSGQDGERAFASAEELAFGEQEQAVFEESGKLAWRDDHATAEAAVDDAWREATDFGTGDVCVEAVNGTVGVSSK